MWSAYGVLDVVTIMYGVYMNNGDELYGTELTKNLCSKNTHSPRLRVAIT